MNVGATCKHIEKLKIERLATNRCSTAKLLVISRQTENGVSVLGNSYLGYDSR